MATISLYSSKVNIMPELISQVASSVSDLKSEFSTIKSKAYQIDSSVCNLDDTIASLQQSVSTCKDMKTQLKKTKRDIEDFIDHTVSVDESVSDYITTSKDDFYDLYDYLKPDCEKGFWESVGEALESFAEWCGEAFSAFVDFCADLFSSLGEWLWDGLQRLGNWLWSGITGYFKWLWNGLKGIGKWFLKGLQGIGNWFLGLFDAILSGPWGILKWAWGGIKGCFSWLFDGIKGCFDWLIDGIKGCFSWLLGGIKSMLKWALNGVLMITFDYSRAITKFVRRITATITGPGHPAYTYDANDPRSMADALGIDYDEYLETMRYSYGLDDEISELYLKLYLEIANDPANAYMNEREVACEFNRMVASLCINYDGSATRWHLTTDNYSTADAYQMLMDDYGFTEAQATDFITALNIQHGSSYSTLEASLNGTGYSRFNGNLYNGADAPTVEYFNGNTDAPVMKDLVHEAIQFVEFNDYIDPVDFASGSTDRMISYSGDITSTRYDAQDFQSDIDANNVQVRLQNSNNNFIRVQQEYNYSNSTNNTSRSEFINNNGGIDNIRNNINYDIRSIMGGYIIDHDYMFKPGERVTLYEPRVQEFIDFLNEPH